MKKMSIAIHKLTHFAIQEDVPAKLKGHQSQQFQALDNFLNNCTLLNIPAVRYNTSATTAP